MTRVATATPERVLTRAPGWVAIAAWGFGLVAVALGAAGVVGLQADALSRGLGGLSAIVGAGALVWGAVALATGNIPAPRVAPGGVFVVAGIAVALLATAPGRAAVLAIAVLIGLGVVLACGIVHATRRPSAGTGLWGLVAAAAVVTMLVVPALGVCQGAALLAADGSVAPLPAHEGH
jgi:hypothetical protein